MEGLAHLVTQSLKRHNFEPVIDHRRLQWSRWFRCESSFDLLLVPSKPGLFAMGEEGPAWAATLRDYEVMIILGTQMVLTTPGFPSV